MKVGDIVSHRAATPGGAKKSRFRIVHIWHSRRPGSHPDEPDETRLDIAPAERGLSNARGVAWSLYTGYATGYLAEDWTVVQTAEEALAEKIMGRL